MTSADIASAIRRPRRGRTGVGDISMVLTANVARAEGRFGEQTISEREGQASQALERWPVATLHQMCESCRRLCVQCAVLRLKSKV
jgi:hypothetical protein